MSYDGLKNDEKGEEVITGLQVTADAKQSSPAGRYDIAPNHGTATNYEIEYVSMALTVTPSKNPELDAAKDVAKPRPADLTMPTMPSVNVSAPTGPQVYQEAYFMYQTIFADTIGAVHITGNLIRCDLATTQPGKEGGQEISCRMVMPLDG